MCRLRTNNDFKLRVLIYRCFTVLSMLFLKFSVCLDPFYSNFNVFKSLFVLIFIYVSLCFARNLSKDESGDFEQRNAEETTYGACDGLSCL